MKTFKYTVEIVVPDNTPEDYARQYVKDAVRCHGGAFHPDDPLFGIPESNVLVKRYRTPVVRTSPRTGEPS